MNDKGFTLIELIISIVLLGIIVLGTAGMVRICQKSFLSTQGSSTASQDANMAMQLMVRELRQAKGISAPASPNTGSSNIVFKSINDVYIKYQKNGSALERIYNCDSTGNGGTTSVLADNVQTLTYKYDYTTANRLIDINLLIVNTEDNKKTFNDGGTSVKNRDYLDTYIQLHDSVRPRNL